MFAGDVMLSRGVRRAILMSNDPALPFRNIAPLLASADIAFVNLESPFSDRGPYHETGLIFHAPPDTIAGLQLAGIAIASTANNHSRDCANYGVEYTVRWLRSHGIAPLGSGETAAEAHSGVVLVRHGIRFGFLGYTYDQKNGNWHDDDQRIAMTDIPTMKADVEGIKKRCDVVIVSMHNGIEYAPRPTRNQIEFAHAAIDAGAVLVIGHHPHVIQPSEKYKGGWIYYSLGNFIFDQYQRIETQHGDIADVQFDGPSLTASYTIPVKITPAGPEIESEP
jgi:poly-gamma-glutamate synthesis protein (capsule biosynthesis protein)